MVSCGKTCCATRYKPWELPPTLPFVFHRPSTEIFGLALELRERIDAWPLL